MSRQVWSSVFIILGIALLLRIPLLGGSFWLDEAAQALESSRPLAQQLLIRDDFQPPLLHLILHFAMYLSSSEWWLRLIGAVIPGLGSIWFTYLIGKKLGSDKVGLAAALLLATSSFHIFYSQELRQYALPTQWATASWYCLLMVLSQAKSARSWHRNRWWWGFIIITVFGLYSSYLYPFLVLSQLGYVLIVAQKKLWPVATGLTVATLGFLPILPLLSQQLKAGGNVRTSLPGWAEVVSTPQLKAIPLVLGKFTFGVMNLELNWFFLLTTTGLGVIGTMIIYQLWRGKKSLRFVTQPNWLMPICWLGITLIASWIVSFWIPVVQPKRLLLILPAFYLAASTLALAGTKPLTRQLGLAFFSLLLAINLVGTAAYYTNPQLQRENWHSAYSELVTKYPPDQSIAVFAYIAPFSPLVWYDSAGYPTLATGTLHIDQKPDLRGWLEPITEYRYVVVFDYLRDLTDPDDKLIQEIEAYDYQLVDLIDYANIGFIRIFAKEESTLGMGQLNYVN